MDKENTYGPYNQYEPYEDVVYRLTGYGISNEYAATYPRFNIFKAEESIHMTLDEAERRIRQLSDESVSPQKTRWQSFLISEVPIGVHCTCQMDGQRCRSYSCRGEFIAQTKVSSIPDRYGNREIYWGREPQECRFKAGDIVEVVCGDQVSLEIIWRLPFGLKYASSRMPKTKPEKPMSFHLDDTDDNYTTVNPDGGYPDKTNVISCYPATTLPLDESIITRLRKAYEDCCND